MAMVQSASCFAVGSYIDSQGAVRTLTEWWNGVNWKIVASPNRAGAISNTLVARGILARNGKPFAPMTLARLVTNRPVSDSVEA